MNWRYRKLGTYYAHTGGGGGTELHPHRGNTHVSCSSPALTGATHPLTVTELIQIRASEGYRYTDASHTRLDAKLPLTPRVTHHPFLAESPSITTPLNFFGGDTTHSLRLSDGKTLCSTRHLKTPSLLVQLYTTLWEIAVPTPQATLLLLEGSVTAAEASRAPFCILYEGLENPCSKPSPPR